MSDIISRRQRTPWFWPDFMYYAFGDGREHDATLKVLHSFTYKVSLKLHLRDRTSRRVPAGPSAQVIAERSENVSHLESDSDSDHGRRKRQAFLDMLLKTEDEDGNKMSHGDIQEEVDTFMFRVGGRRGADPERTAEGKCCPRCRDTTPRLRP